MNTVMNTWKNSRLDLLVVMGLALLTVAVYWQSAQHGFIRYDDPTYVTENLVVQRGLSRDGLVWAFTTATAANWHPLTWLSHMMDVQLFGMNPGSHHLVNLLFHVLNTALVFLVLKSMTQNLWCSAFVAALFALHPLHVESVAWIAERKDVLSTFFWLLTMMAYASYARRPGIFPYTVVLLCFGLGLMAKPMLVTLPVILLLLDYWPLGRMRETQKITPAPPPSSEKGKQKKKSRRQPTAAELPSRPGKANPWQLARPLIYEKIPLVVLSVLFSVIAVYTQRQGMAMSSLSDLSLLDRTAIAFVSYVTYLWKMIWPSGLAFFYPIEVPTWPVVLICVVLFCAATAASIRWAGRFPYLLVGWLWFMISLLPVIGIIKVGEAAMADRYTYITLTGPFIAIAWGLRDLTAGRPFRRVALAGLAAVIVLAMATVTYAQIRYWRDDESLFLHAIQVTRNNHVAHHNLGVYYMDQGNLDEAGRQLKRVLEISPQYPRGLYNWGILMLREGRVSEAVEPLRKATVLDPAPHDAYYALGRAYLLLNRENDAIAAFESAVRTGTFKAETCVGIAEALTAGGRLDEALQYIDQALKWMPSESRLYYNAGLILAYQGRLDESLAYFRKAVLVNPDYAKAHNNLGSVLLLKGQTDEAVRHFQEAIRIDPNYPMARANLKDALAQQRKNREHPQKGAP